MGVVRAEQLIRSPERLSPHVVLLGAGASKAAFPKGDAYGRCVPVMNEVTHCIGLDELLSAAGMAAGSVAGFEEIYEHIKSNPRLLTLAEEVEHRVQGYFTALELPAQATMYDRLLLSLRSWDAVLTFNWDPFLFDAHRRNRGSIPLPGIYFLHGNVRIGTCRTGCTWGANGTVCPNCGEIYAKVPLVYPMKEKEYSDSYTRASWEHAQKLFASAFHLTIFGYSAPQSDQKARALLHRAWASIRSRSFQHVDIIDIEEDRLLRGRWSDFASEQYLHPMKDFAESRIARWPRRTCEAMKYPMRYGRPVEAFPFPHTEDLQALREMAYELARFESGVDAD